MTAQANCILAAKLIRARSDSVARCARLDNIREETFPHPMQKHQSDHAEVLLACSEAGGRNYAAVTAIAEIINDRGLIRGLWSKTLDVWFPTGQDGPRDCAGGGHDALGGVPGRPLVGHGPRLRPIEIMHDRQSCGDRRSGNVERSYSDGLRMANDVTCMISGDEFPQGCLPE